MCSESVRIAYLCLVAVLVATADSKDNLPPNKLRGHGISISEVSYLVQLRDGGGKYFCSGTLVTERHVVTTGDCVSGRKHGNIYVVVDADPNPLNDKHVIKLTTLGNDVAVLVLKEALSRHKVMNLPENPVDLGTREIDVFGWSITTKDKNVLLRAITPRTFKTKILKRDLCKGEITSTTFCASSPKKLATGCGDPGSPAISGGLLVGISHGLCSKSKPGHEVYTSVSAVLQFIQDNVKIPK